MVDVVLQETVSVEDLQDLMAHHLLEAMDLVDVLQEIMVPQVLTVKDLQAEVDLVVVRQDLMVHQVLAVLDLAEGVVLEEVDLVDVLQEVMVLQQVTFRLFRPGRIWWTFVRQFRWVFLRWIWRIYIWPFQFLPSS
ncbi:hypothetical protein C0J52_15194 [Blattella germanica]|nr:hypothetical protein C0J52_15194 [Blattella germanica]